MKLEIKLTDERYKQTSIDEPGEMTTTWEADMDDCSVHAWFKVFESVLGAAGMTEKLVMRGACQQRALADNALTSMSHAF